MKLPKTEGSGVRQLPALLRVCRCTDGAGLFSPVGLHGSALRRVRGLLLKLLAPVQRLDLERATLAGSQTTDGS
eukprot:15455439-Alexandrium_andersonii.AAC.2